GLDHAAWGGARHLREGGHASQAQCRQRIVSLTHHPRGCRCARAAGYSPAPPDEHRLCTPTRQMEAGWREAFDDKAADGCPLALVHDCPKGMEDDRLA